jgi:hypothetical protein
MSQRSCSEKTKEKRIFTSLAGSNPSVNSEYKNKAQKPLKTKHREMYYEKVEVKFTMLQDYCLLF